MLAAAVLVAARAPGPPVWISWDTGHQPSLGDPELLAQTPPGCRDLGAGAAGAGREAGQQLVELELPGGLVPRYPVLLEIR